MGGKAGGQPCQGRGCKGDLGDEADIDSSGWLGPVRHNGAALLFRHFSLVGKTGGRHMRGVGGGLVRGHCHKILF